MKITNILFILILLFSCTNNKKIGQNGINIIETGNREIPTGNQDDSVMFIDPDDIFNGYFFFDSIELEAIHNIDNKQYIELNKEVYIKIMKIDMGEYKLETNFFLINEHSNNVMIDIKYPNHFFDDFNAHKDQFGERFYQIAAGSLDDLHIHMDFFYNDPIITIYYQYFFRPIVGWVTNEDSDELPVPIFSEENEYVFCKVFFRKDK